MSLGTLDRSPPPFFKQGPSATTRLLFFSALAVFLMVADHKLHLTGPVRSAVSVALHPLQRLSAVPIDLLNYANSYFQGLHQARSVEQTLRERLAQQAAREAQADILGRENDKLRKLLDLREQMQLKSTSAEIIYETADPYTRKVVIDRGGMAGLKAGSPVVDETGVLGQITRVYPLTSEVTLLNDRNFAIPVFNTRNQARALAYGDDSTVKKSQGSVTQVSGLELRFMASNADVQVGDKFVTSGLDGVYPPGLPVGQVVRIDRQSESSFAKIQLTPLAGLGQARFVLVIQPIAEQLPQHAPHATSAASEPAHGKKKGGHK